MIDVNYDSFFVPFIINGKLRPTIKETSKQNEQNNNNRKINRGLF